MILCVISNCHHGQLLILVSSDKGKIIKLLQDVITVV